MESPLTREEIVRQMTAIRVNLDGEVGGIVFNARQLTDWRYYVRNHPWISLLGAMGIGYFAVPGSAPAPAASGPVTSSGSPSYTEPPAAPARAAVAGGLFGSLTSLATNYALRMAMQYATSQLTSRFTGDHRSPNSPKREEVRP